MFTSSLVKVVSGRWPLEGDEQRVLRDVLHPQVEDPAWRRDVGSRRKTLLDEHRWSDGLSVKRRGWDRVPDWEVAAAALADLIVDVVDVEAVWKQE